VIDRDVDFAEDYPKESRPDLRKELSHFRKFGDKWMELDMLLRFTHFNANRVAAVTVDGMDPVFIVDTDNEFVVREADGTEVGRFPSRVELPLPPPTAAPRGTFQAPLFGVTVLGSSHGFDPKGSTSGYVLWINRRGLMIDPPPNSTNLLQQEGIPPSIIDGVILTHCHADHDAGTFQKILQEGRITLYTTQTIVGSFLRKYSALSGLGEDLVRSVFKYRAVRIGEAIRVRGAEFRFFYALHSIPCIGFEVFFGDKSMVFTGDHMNDPTKLKVRGGKTRVGGWGRGGVRGLWLEEDEEGWRGGRAHGVCVCGSIGGYLTVLCVGTSRSRRRSVLTMTKRA
jgi:glyoxylase-like metal-dependent hydrolase (beta-lactamase superfamily II)